METEISEKIERLTRILSEEAGKFPKITVDQYSTGTYGYNWKVYLDNERQLGTIAFTTEVPLSEQELRVAFRHELKRSYGVRCLPLFQHCLPLPSSRTLDN